MKQCGNMKKKIASHQNFLPPTAIVAPQYMIVQQYRDFDDDTLPLRDELDTEFDISFGRIAEKHRQPITDLQMALVRAGLLVKGGLIMADGTLLPFHMARVLRYFVINSTHLNTIEQQFILNAKNLEAAQIIVQFAREHPELYRYFGNGVKKILIKEYGHNVPESLRKQQGRKAKPKAGRPIYERVMHDQPIIAPMPEARVVLERMRQRTPIHHNVIDILPTNQRVQSAEIAMHHPTYTNPAQRVRMTGPIPSPHHLGMSEPHKKA